MIDAGNKKALSALCNRLFVLYCKFCSVKNLVLSKKKIALVVVLSIVLFIVSLVLYMYHHATYTKDYPPKTPRSKTKEAVFKFVQSVNPFASKLFSGPSNDYPEFDVSLSRRNIKYINDVIARGLDSSKNIYNPVGNHISYRDNNFTKQTKTKVTYEGKVYKAKIKIHGIWYPNYIKKKKSYTIKFKKNQLVNNMRKFSLAVPEKQFLGGLMAYEISKKYGYMTAEYGVARLKFNGVDQGLYFYEESLGKELLEKNGMSGYEVIKSIDEWSYQYNSPHYTPTIYDLSYRDYKSITDMDNGQLLLYDALMHSDDYDEIVKRIDFDKFARHEAMRILFGTYHCIEGDNLALMLNTATGRFSPYFRTEGAIRKLKYAPLTKTFDRDMFGRYLQDGTPYSENILFKTLISNNEFRALRNTYLQRIAKDSKEILGLFNSLKTKYQEDIENDFTNNYSLPYYRYRSKLHGKNLAYNLKVISNYLNYARVHASLVQTSANTLHLNIKPDSNSPLRLTKLLIDGVDPTVQLKIIDAQDQSEELLTVADLPGYFSGKEFMVNLDDQLEPVVTNFDFEFIFQKDVSVSDMQMAFTNVTTGKLVKEKNLFTRFVKKPLKFSLKRELSEEQLTSAGLEHFTINGSEVILHAGLSKVVEDIVLPRGYRLKIEDGAKIYIAAGKSILVNGGLIVNGAAKPVIVGNLKKGDAFGVLAAVGDGNSIVEINGLELYGGNEDRIDGLYLSGALSLYNHSSVKITNSHIHHNRADDGLNVKDAAVYFENNIFSNNFADQVDIDISSGSVIRNRFLATYPFGDFDQVEIPVDQNGDGLDFSGSRVIVHGNTFDGFEDKGISVGEKTNALIYGNHFQKNRSAITVKDQSKIYLCKNNIDNASNAFMLEAYQKKPIFKHPSIYVICGGMNLEKIKFSKATRLFSLQDTNSVSIESLPQRFEKDVFRTLDDLTWVAQ